MDRAAEIAEFFRALEQKPFDYDFYAVMRRIECLFDRQPRLGRAKRPVDEPVRFALEPSMSFAPAALAAFEQSKEGRPPRLVQRFFGLLGPNGPLPLHLTDFARERVIHGGDVTLARFLDVFHHRFVELFYRAWAQAQPTVNLDRPREDRYAVYVGALLGIGTAEKMAGDAIGDHAKLYYSGLLARQVRNADGLRAWLAGYFRVPVAIEEFVGHHLRLPEEDLTRLGVDTAGARLGVGTVLGARVWDRQNKFRIEFGPLDLQQFENFLPGGSAIERLVAAVRQYLCYELEWDARLVLRRAEVPRIMLGKYGRLGWTTWLGKYPRNTDAGDLTLEAERLVAAQEARAAASRRRAAMTIH